MATNYKKLFADICNDNLSEKDISKLTLKWKNIIELIQYSRYLKINSTKNLQEFLTLVFKRGNFLDSTIQIKRNDYLFTQGLIKVFERNKQWIRKVEEWKPKSHNKRKQFSHLLRHLFGKYEVPLFMDHVWFRNDQGSYRYRDWYVNLIRGESLRKQKSKVKVTKKIAHYFGTAPENYSVEEALWWGIIHSLGGNVRIVREFNSARPAKIYEAQEFWKRFISFIINNPMIDKSQIGPIIDFINYQRFDEQETYENEVLVMLPPPQPNFSFNNRNPNTLLALVSTWHRGTSSNKHGDLIHFSHSKIKPYLSIKTNGNFYNHSIKQLTNNFELFKEGKELGHCVGSYVNSCRKNHCTIWSLTQHDAHDYKKLVTIEVDSDNQIVEMRGKHNRYPTDGEMAMIQKWVILENLYISEWVY
jgi:hypothetical protein